MCIVNTALLCVVWRAGPVPTCLYHVAKQVPVSLLVYVLLTGDKHPLGRLVLRPGAIVLGGWELIVKVSQSLPKKS